jgi:hypothetical protein
LLSSLSKRKKKTPTNSTYNTISDSDHSRLQAVKLCTGYNCSASVICDDSAHDKVHVVNTAGVNLSTPLPSKRRHAPSKSCTASTNNNTQEPEYTSRKRKNTGIDPIIRRCPKAKKRKKLPSLMMLQYDWKENGPTPKKSPRDNNYRVSPSLSKSTIVSSMRTSNLTFVSAGNTAGIGFDVGWDILKARMGNCLGSLLHENDKQCSHSRWVVRKYFCRKGISLPPQEAGQNRLLDEDSLDHRMMHLLGTSNFETLQRWVARTHIPQDCESLLTENFTPISNQNELYKMLILCGYSLCQRLWQYKSLKTGRRRVFENFEEVRHHVCSHGIPQLCPIRMSKEDETRLVLWAAAPPYRRRLFRFYYYDPSQSRNIGRSTSEAAFGTQHPNTKLAL